MYILNVESIIPIKFILFWKSWGGNGPQPPSIGATASEVVAEMYRMKFGVFLRFMPLCHSGWGFWCWFAGVEPGGDLLGFESGRGRLGSSNSEWGWMRECFQTRSSNGWDGWGVGWVRGVGWMQCSWLGGCGILGERWNVRFGYR